MIKQTILAVLAMLLLGTPAIAGHKVKGKGETCSKVVNINSIHNVLYKPSNVHGGRGMSFLVQNRSEQTGSRYIEIRSTKCKLLGRFGLWATDYPFGSRYYQQTGGSGNRVSDILSQLGGQTSILVQGRGNRWILIPNITGRQGTITKP